MRVASNSLSSSLVNQLNLLNARQLRLQNQAATGQKVQWGDDDPAALQRALDLQSSSRSNSQYEKNIAFLKERYTTSLSSLQGLNKIADRAGEIAILADGAKSADQLNAYASEVDKLIRQAVDTGNTKHRGDYLFGGTRTDRAPFVLSETADHEITGVSYQGNADSPELEIAPGATVPMQLPGANTSGTGSHGLLVDSRDGTDLFGHLLSLYQHLRAGDTAAIAQTDQAAIQKDEDHVIFRIADGGAVQTRLETARTTTAGRTTQLRQALSDTTDADLSETVVQLSATQTAYKAALQSGANLLGVSLMDYLR